MTDDETRQARVDALIGEMESTIAEARDTSARMARMFQDMGIEDETVLRELVRSDKCSPALRDMVEEDLARLDREMADSNAALLASAGRSSVRRPHRRSRRMTRI